MDDGRSMHAMETTPAASLNTGGKAENRSPKARTTGTCRSPSRKREKNGGRYGWKAFPIPLLLSVLQMEIQEKWIRAIAESVKVSTSFAHKTCKSLSPQTTKFQPAKISRSVSLNQKPRG